MKTASLTLSQAIDLGMQYQQARQFDEARALYRKVLGIDGNNVDALHLLGTVNYQTGNYAAAVKWIDRALALKPHPQMLLNHGLAHEALGNHEQAATSYRAASNLKPDYAAAFDNLGDALTRLHRLAEAIAAYRDAVRVDPDLATAWSSLGNALRLTGQLDEAIGVLERALALNAGSAEANLNLGSVYYAQGKLSDALVRFQRTVGLAPDFPEAHYNLGSVHYREGRLDEAVVCFRRAVELDPDNADAFNNLGLALLEQGRREEGAQCLRKVVELRPDSPEMLANLGIALHELGAAQEALACFERALEIDPDEGTARHFSNVARGVQSARAPANYVRDLFDAYADKFDRQLIGPLEYRVPDLVFAALAAALSPERRQLDVLDLGCGTGLMGPLLKPLSRQLVGVDLSQGMLSKAQLLGVYDRLESADLIEFLYGAGAHTFDVVTAADVFVYLGDLAAVFVHARRVLRDDGLFAFTVERSAGEGAPFLLAGSGRYKHSLAYLESLCAAHRFRCLQSGDVILRKERNLPIEGRVYLLSTQS